MDITAPFEGGIIGSNPVRSASFKIGLWSSGRAIVSKTFDEGSIPSRPAILFKAPSRG
jgi:hypothetical protein